MAKTTVIHVREMKPGDVYIGRSFAGHRDEGWGNPFKEGRDGSRQAVVAKYDEYVKGSPELMTRLHELKGKRLACWCAPKLCHGNVLARLADELPEDPPPAAVAQTRPKAVGSRPTKIKDLRPELVAAFGLPQGSSVQDCKFCGGPTGLSNRPYYLTVTDASGNKRRVAQHSDKLYCVVCGAAQSDDVPVKTTKLTAAHQVARSVEYKEQYWQKPAAEQKLMEAKKAHAKKQAEDEWLEQLIRENT